MSFTHEYDFDLGSCFRSRRSERWIFMASNRYIPEITLCISVEMRYATVSCEGVLYNFCCVLSG